MALNRKFVELDDMLSAQEVISNKVRRTSVGSLMLIFAQQYSKMLTIKKTELLLTKLTKKLELWNI